MTEKRLAANRRNVLKSTGPKTPEGKFRAYRFQMRGWAEVKARYGIRGR
jgi:hypothetical protein